MNKYTLITFLALLIFVIAIPLYAVLEPQRMEQSQLNLQQQFVSDAAVMYVENCAICHGASGEGIGSMPSLDNDGLRQAEYDFLYKTIARGRYDTVMAGWHEDEGGIFNEYELDELVALIRYADWSQVGEMAAAQGLIPPTLPIPEVEDAFLEEVAALSPEGSIWAEGISLYANNCTICHGINGEGSELGVMLNSEEVRGTETAVLIRTITEGVPTTLMAGWDNVLTRSEIESLVAFLQNWDIIEAGDLQLTAPEPIRIDLNNPEEVFDLGARLYNTTCIACHGEDGSGGTGPVLNSQQVLTNNTDQQIRDTIINGGHRPNSNMPAFGDRLTSVEIDALVTFVRAWEPTAPVVENPRGTDQGGGPPWLRSNVDGESISPQGNGNGNGYRGGANPDARGGNGQGQGQGQGNSNNQNQDSGVVPIPLSFRGQVVVVNENQLTFRSETDGILVEAMMGPPWFWSESSITLNVGDQIELEGFESPDHMELNWLTNITTGEMIQFRTADGMPVWNQ